MKTRIVAIAGMALAVTGCATVIAGTTQDIRIVSDPPGAECRVSRDEVALAVVTTPATVNVPRSKRNIMAVCRKEGLPETAETIPSEIHGGTVGNVIAGGLIGVAVDAASGANNQYRDVTFVAFAPESFVSADERDRYFTEMGRRGAITADTEVKRVMDGCPQSKREFCTIEADRVKAAKQSALASIEQKKASARIGK
jgi:hypothetical protein